MRSASSKGKMRLRSGGYKCSLCGRRVVDAALLERHLKNMHNIPSRGRKVVYKAKPRPQSKEDMEKAFDNLIREKIMDEAKTKSKKKQEQNDSSMGDPLAFTEKELKKVDPAKHNDSVVETESTENDGDTKNVKKFGRRRAEFECPVCGALFNVYYSAHKHIQRLHPINALGVKVPINSPDLIQPIRVEECLRCYSKMKSTEPHNCQNMDSKEYAQYQCALCNEGFMSLKSFDLHVAGLHSDRVESMFFPTELELTNWRLEMERETNTKYVHVDTYDCKKIYRCSYSKMAPRTSTLTPSMCPSTMVIQEFPKGTQIHLYPEHCDHHNVKPYPSHLSMKYINYSISTFLKCEDDLGTTTIKKPSNKDMYKQFQTLMENIIVEAKKLDVACLKVLVEKALDMSTVLNKGPEIAKPNKSMTDKEITEVLEKPQKRRTSTDCVSPSLPLAAKRTRNKSVFTEEVVSPKIVSTYSLAELKADVKESNPKPIESVTPETEKPKPMATRSTRFNQSPSFNDTYKDFIDKTIKAASNIKNTRPRKSGGKIDEPQKAPVTVSSEVTDVKVQAITSDVTAKIEGINRINNVTITKVEAPKPATYRPGPKFTKVTPKFETNFEEENGSSSPPIVKKAKAAPKESSDEKIAKKPLDFKYEVVEQENDCNILVLKF